MIAKAVFKRNGTIIGEFPIVVEGPGDLAKGAKEAYAEFRRAFPSVSLFDKGISVTFAKMEEDAKRP